MPTFETPDPISATVQVVAGDVRISAGERTATTVEVAPTDAASEEDRKAAELTRVEYADGRLLVKAPKLRSWLPRHPGGSIELTIALPAGSSLQADAGLADVTVDGELGDCRIKTGIGRIQVDRAATLNLRSGIGDVAVDHASGHADVNTGSGEIRVRELGATGVIKSSNGDTWVGIAAGDLRVRSANGSITVDESRATVGAKSANGDVRLGDVRGSVVLETSLGDLDVGIPEGTAAFLDVRASAGRVHNELEAAQAPDRTAEKVEVRARTAAGDVLIHRP
jgi:Putative adhesin